MWTRYFMRTAFILIVAITTLTQELDADIGTWIQLDDGMTMGTPGMRPRSKIQVLRSQSMGLRCMQDHGAKVYFGRMMPARLGSRNGTDCAFKIWTGNAITEKFAESSSRATRLSM